MTPEEFAELSENLDGIVAVLAGYKAKLVSAGFDEVNAEYMAVQFHELYLKNHLEISGTLEDQ